MSQSREFDAGIAQATALLAAIAPDGIDALRSGLARALADGSVVLAEGEAMLETLQASAPDLATTEARLAQARSAGDRAVRETAKAREDLAGLNATIAALADEGLEEELSVMAEERADAEARAVRYEAEVRSLTRLRQALEEARTEACDAHISRPSFASCSRCCPSCTPARS